MKIAVKDLRSNPYRDMDNYPIDREKVEALKQSIEETSFWDNLLCRKTNGKYQIGYGHHRLIAIRELKIKFVDIPVRKIDDATMIKIMANENFQEWSTSPAIINETVGVAKKFLESEIKKCKKWEDMSTLNSCIKGLFENQKSFSQIKKQHKGKVGQTIILAFLGKPWTQSMIQSALETFEVDEKPIEKGGVSRKATEKLPNRKQVKRFTDAIQEYADAEVPISKADQIKIAEKIVKEEKGRTVDEVHKAITEHLPKLEDTFEEYEEVKPPSVDKFFIECSTLAESLVTKLEKGVIPNLNQFQDNPEVVNKLGFLFQLQAISRLTVQLTEWYTSNSKNSKPQKLIGD